MGSGAFRGPKRISDSLKQELEALVSHQTWVLETEFRSSARAVLVLNCLASHLSSPNNVLRKFCPNLRKTYRERD